MLNLSSPVVSIIIPCHNSTRKIGKCLDSIISQKTTFKYDVLFIDDASSDGTVDMLKAKCEANSNWKLICLQKNSGSPSLPRNIGIDKCIGRYVFFLDSDDEISEDAIEVQISIALSNSLDIIRSSMNVFKNNSLTKANQITDWSSYTDHKSKVQKILTSQTLTKSCFFLKSFLQSHEIRFDERLRMGEDTIFVAEAISKSASIEYIDHISYTYNAQSVDQDSTTSHFGKTELENQLTLWPRMHEIYADAGISYYSSRFVDNLSYIFVLLIHKKDNSIGSTEIERLQNFLKSIKLNLNLSRFDSRKQELIQCMLTDTPKQVLQVLKPRLLIAGHDLKFILPFEPDLSRHFSIDFDIWTEHNTHDLSASEAKLQWAEYIWCEWLLGNAVWYSKNKRKGQKLVIRMHRFELGLYFGDQIDIGNVDSIISVCVLFFEKLLERFPSYSRSKIRLIPLGYDLKKYKFTTHDSKRFNLAIIGILPSRKGLHAALELLDVLCSTDSRYKLHIYGKEPSEVSWINSDKDEMTYFDACNNFIETRQLSSNIIMHGHSDIPISLYSDKIGFVLSLSTSSPGLPGFEAFHTAVGDGLSAQCVSLIKHYDGSEFVWPNKYIFESISEIETQILAYSNHPELYESATLQGFQFMKDRYSLEKFTLSLHNLFRGL